jgi:2,4-dienoyl-CoA reductase-like NADH-dependent reductase (Old Yellow Enzyme family)
MHCFNDGHGQGMTLLSDRIHYFGAKACIQLSVGFGRQGHTYEEDVLVPAASANVPYEITADRMMKNMPKAMAGSERGRQWLIGPMTRELTISEIHHEQKEFANSAQLAVICGFDAIEIHAPHGYLEHQFLSPLTNRRTDYYGGPWRNRKRFLNEVMEQVRYACPGVAVGVRISAEEHVEGGLTREEMIDLAQDLEARGADYISLSDGGGYEELTHLIPTKEIAQHFPETGADFKAVLKIPVMIPSQHDAVKADQDIAAGKFDVSALGRQLLCDPEYANKLAAGRQEDIDKCARCNTCILRALARTSMACPNNPWLGREYADPSLMLGPFQKHEHLIPPGWEAGLPALDRPWWHSEIPMARQHFRPFRGPGAEPKLGMLGPTKNLGSGPTQSLTQVLGKCEETD